MGLKVALAIFTVALFVKSTWAADHETVLYSFQHSSSTDGAYPYTGVIVDAAGNLSQRILHGVLNHARIFRSEELLQAGRVHRVRADQVGQRFWRD